MTPLSLFEKPPTKSRRVEEALRSAGWGGVDMSTLNAISYRYGSIICTLRKQGHIIHTVAIDRKNGHFKYVWEK